jgi:hypothetical protein
MTFLTETLSFKVSREVMAKFCQNLTYPERYILPRISDSATRLSSESRNS